MGGIKYFFSQFQDMEKRIDRCMYDQNFNILFLISLNAAGSILMEAFGRRYIYQSNQLARDILKLAHSCKDLLR